ncbi:hypothetical protein [Ensifer canadensis]|nr:hypothetical protein [Ensifer canadensis]
MSSRSAVRSDRPQATSIVSVQRASTIAWARLIIKPVVISFNI